MEAAKILRYCPESKDYSRFGISLEPSRTMSSTGILRKKNYNKIFVTSLQFNDGSKFICLPRDLLGGYFRFGDRILGEIFVSDNLQCNKHLFLFILVYF